tara:strand:- start:53 stop:328 length:276 start_codon:yes stop_codon:yes gene_type:complete
MRKKNNMRYEQKAELQDSNKARMYEERYKKWRKKKTNEMLEAKKKQDKLKKYRVIKEFFVEAKDEFEAEKKANYKELQSILIDVQEVVDDE